jgi:hypothetical protein
MLAVRGFWLGGKLDGETRDVLALFKRPAR